MNASFGPYQFGHHTDRGPRDTNQDAVLSASIPHNRWLLAVADGMGGLEEGELASRTALSTLHRSLVDGAGLAEAVRRANAAVEEEAQGRAMGTTLVAATISGGQAEVVNVGDSRAYQADSLGLIQVTRDHTMAQEAHRTGAAPMEGLEADSGRWAKALSRYLGAGPEVEVDHMGPLDLVEGGWLLLCSDGLHSVMTLDAIDEFLSEMKDAQEAAIGLVEEALKSNTSDNVSVALLHWPDSSPAEIPRGQPRPDRRRTSQHKVLIRTSGHKTQEQGVGLGLALKVFLIVIPLMIGLVFLLNWLFSR